METQIEQFRRQVEALFWGRPGPGVRYPKALKALPAEVALEAVDWAERLRTVAQLPGVGVGTLRRWVEVKPKQGSFPACGGSRSRVSPRPGRSSQTPSGNGRFLRKGEADESRDGKAGSGVGRGPGPE